jgi:hypothetical protein
MILTPAVPDAGSRAPRLSPLIHGFQHGLERPAELCDGVFDARWDLWKGCSLHEPISLELLQMQCQHPLAHAGNLAL